MTASELHCLGMFALAADMCVTCCPPAEYVRRYASPGSTLSSKCSDDGSDDKMDEDAQQQEGDSDNFLSSSDDEGDD